MTSVGEKNGLPYTACIKFRFKELEKSIAHPFFHLIQSNYVYKTLIKSLPGDS